MTGTMNLGGEPPVANSREYVVSARPLHPTRGGFAQQLGDRWCSRAFQSSENRKDEFPDSSALDVASGARLRFFISS